MTKFSMYTMQMSASAACADAASACARTMADSYVIFILDAIFVASIMVRVAVQIQQSGSAWTAELLFCIIFYRKRRKV